VAFSHLNFSDAILPDKQKQSISKPSKAKQSRAKPNKAKQSKTKQNQAKPSFNSISISITVEHNIISASFHCFTLH
jgi:hypothetical protein